MILSTTLDYLFKVVLANKILLAIIMKECLVEFKDIDVKTIMNEYIEAHISTDTLVHDQISGANTEKNMDGKRTTFDVLFYAKLPNSDDKIGIIINAEAQSLSYITYDVLNRAHYYNARNISSQYKVFFDGSNYDHLKKVVSIWFILDPIKAKQGSMNRYKMVEEHIEGNVCEDIKNIDKNEIIMVYLSQDKCENEFIQLMSDIKNRNIQFDDLKNELAEKYDIQLDEQTEMEVERMCNYGEYVKNEGRIEGRIELIVKKMMKENLSAIEAMTQMYIDEKEFPILLPKINEIMNTTV